MSVKWPIFNTVSVLWTQNVNRDSSNPFNQATISVKLKENLIKMNLIAVNLNT